jgi:hypothetical protein
MKTTTTTEEVSSNGMKMCVERRNWRQIAPCASEKPNLDRKKRLASIWTRQRITKITKKAHAGRGPENKWEIPGKNNTERLESHRGCEDNQNFL